jgi:hypothetical protein
MIFFIDFPVYIPGGGPVKRFSSGTGCEHARIAGKEGKTDQEGVRERIRRGKKEEPSLPAYEKSLL